MLRGCIDDFKHSFANGKVDDSGFGDDILSADADGINVLLLNVGRHHPSAVTDTLYCDINDEGVGNYWIGAVSPHMIGVVEICPSAHDKCPRREGTASRRKGTKTAKEKGLEIQAALRYNSIVTGAGTRDASHHAGVSKRSQRGGLENRLGESPRGFESLRLRQLSG